MTILKVENLSTGYGKKQVLFNISFEVNKGDIVLVAGSNGSGKSTLLKAIYGMLPQWDDGKVVFDGEDITGKSTASLLKKGLLYIPQKNNLFEDLTVKENLEMAGLTLNKRLLKERFEYVLSLFVVLKTYLNRTPMTLSGGERQLLILAMAILHQPKIILFDEPFSGLSVKNVGFMTDYLRVLNNQYGIAIVLVEHRLKESLRIACKVTAMKLGKVFIELKVTENFDTKTLNSTFL